MSQSHAVPEESDRLVFIPAQYEEIYGPPAPRLTPTEFFGWQRDRLVDEKLAKPADFDKFRNRIPQDYRFLLTPTQPGPVSELNWNELMARTELDGKKGRNHLDPKYLKDEIKVPVVPTMLVGLEDGRLRLNTKPTDSRKNIKREGGIAYTTWRGYIHVLLFPHVLRHHYMDIVGSRGVSKHVPRFFLLDGRPALYAYWEDSASLKWGAPSCGSVET